MYNHCFNTPFKSKLIPKKIVEVPFSRNGFEINVQIYLEKNGNYSAIKEYSQVLLATFFAIFFIHEQTSTKLLLLVVVCLQICVWKYI